MISVSEVFVKIWLKSVGQILRSKAEKKEKEIAVKHKDLALRAT